MDRRGLDWLAMLALNGASESETSPLDPDALHALCAQAFHVGLVDEGRSAFLIALDQNADYASPNFRWFGARYPRFVYVDRVIVAATARGRGLGRSLYEELFRVATAAGHVVVTCEVNLEPPNPASQAFHASLGFHEVGRASLAGSAKVVRYLARPIGKAPREVPTLRP
jgi:hypothetical protein